MSTPLILYILECTHVQPDRQIGIKGMICLNCSTKNQIQVRNITDIHVYEWRVSCQTCNYGPWCGLSQDLAKHHTKNHLQKHPDHSVKILYTINPYAKKQRDRLMEGNNAAPSSGPKQ